MRSIYVNIVYKVEPLLYQNKKFQFGQNRNSQ